MKTPLNYIIRITFFLLTLGVLISSTRAQSVQAIEYFFDKDPGVGQGTRINLNPAADIDTALVFDMTGISFGLHQLFVRARDTSARWGLYHIYPVIKGVGSVPVIVQKIEYYFDKDPGQGNGIPVNFGGALSVDTTINIDLTTVTEGLHQVFFRAMDNTGKWSLYHGYPVIKGSGYSDPLTVNKLEYFFDTDPGIGKGTLLASGQRLMIDSTFLLTVPETNKDSLNLFIRSMDNRGLWSLYHDTMIAVNCNLYPLRANIDFMSAACGNTIANFKDTTSAYQWKWFFGNGDSASTQEVVYSYKQSGSYNASHYIINKSGCISDTVIQKIIVQQPAIVDAGPGKEINQGDVITLQPAITGNDSAYLWTPNLYLDNNSIKNPTVTATNDVVYTIAVTAKGGCISSDSVTIKVNKTPQLVNIPNAFSPNGDGINDTWVITYLATYADCRVQIFNRYGETVFSATGYNIPWDGRYRNKPLPFGTYYYIIVLGKGKKPLTGSVSILY